MARLLNLISLLALGALVAAAPPFSTPPSKSDTAATVTPLAKTSAAVVKPTSISAADPVSTNAITIPDSAIEAAPVQDISSHDNSLVSIPAVVSNSTLVDSRPDLQVYVNTATNVTGNATAHKRSLDKRQNAGDCLSNQDPTLDVSPLSWIHLATRICKIWYPGAGTFQYDPSAPYPINLKSHSLGPINLGGGQILSFTFTYGVEDWGTQAPVSAGGFGWQPFYVPQSQSICIADFTTLINEMDTDCLYDTGFDTSQDITGLGQPKWYTFTASH